MHRDTIDPRLTKGRVVLLALLLVPAVRAAPNGEAKRPESSASTVNALLQRMTIPVLLKSDQSDVTIALSDLEEIRTAVWKKYVAEIKADAARRAEHASKELRFSGSTMRFEYATIGEKPKNGYPLYIALHGGGGAPARVNDLQWQQMTRYYRDSVREGVYVAPRGVSDTWNLHFRSASYPLYDRLIENMIIFENVDPNRVYLLGYSAGGDGIYQIVPRMADRWAAANMSAGHHNGVNPTNLYHVPFLLQVGERDGAYKRNQATVEFQQKLAALRSDHPDGYVHELFVHLNRPHNFVDRDPKEGKQEVIADPAAWREKNDRRAVSRNTNAVAWLRPYTRNPLPARIIWDLKTRADRTGIAKDGTRLWPVENKGKQHYWLDIGGHDADSLGVSEIAVALDTKKNEITIEKGGSYLRILLTAHLLDFSRPVTITAGGTRFAVTVRPNLRTMLRTVLERGDPHYIFEADCVVERKGETWRVTGLDG